MVTENITEKIALTDSAVQALTKILQSKNLDGFGVRVFIAGSGCSGYQYGLAFEGTTRPEDTVFQFDQIKLIVDEVSINYLRGASIDYLITPTGEGFKISNPNMPSSCDCSNSAESQCSGCG